MGEAAHGNDGNNPFASLAIWRDKVASDLEESVQSAGFRLSTLLDQSKEVEQVSCRRREAPAEAETLNLTTSMSTHCFPPPPRPPFPPP